MAQECPPLNNLTRNPDLVLIGNTGIPRLSTYSRTVGTRVNLTCVSEFRLQPNNPQLVCLNSLEWDKSNPVCTNAPLPATTTAAPGGLSDDQTLIIAITGGIGGFIFLILLVLIAAICRMQRRAQKRRKVLENPPPPPRTEVTSAGSMYALDNRGVSGYEKAYPLYPPSYSSRDIDQDKLGYGRNSIALPPTSSVHNAYTNRGYDRADESQFLSPRSREEYSYRERRRPDDDVATGPHGYPETRIPDESHEIPRSREEILETLARERLDQLQHDRARFQSLDAVYDPSRADGRRVRGARAGEAKVRAERTLQYVEEHSSGSATPSFGGPRDLPGVHQGALTRQGPGGYDGTGPTRYLDDYREHDRIRGNIEDQRQQQQLYPADYRVPLDPRVAGEDYGSYAGGPIERAYDSNDRTGYGPRIFPRSEDIWRPQTKTHYTEKRRR